MGLLIKQDDGKLIRYTAINRGYISPFTESVLTGNSRNSWVIDRNGKLLGRVDPEGKPLPLSNKKSDAVQYYLSGVLYGLKRGNPDALNSVDQLRVRRSVDRNPRNPYAVGSYYAPDDSPTTFLENGSGTPAPDQPPQFGENPQPQAPVKSAGKSRKVRKGRKNGNLSRSGGNVYASAGIPRGGVVSPATMMRTSGVQPVQAAYGNNAPMGEGFDYTRTYDPMSNSMRPNDSYSYYDPSRNAPSGGDGTDLTLTYDPMTGQMVRR